jgi:proteasome lid subunit RPN8/RPN11
MTTTGERAKMVHALTAEQFAEIVRQAEAGYPEEICGIVTGKPGSPETYRVRQARNVANERLQKDTTGNQRDARTAYSMDPLDIQRIQDEADAADSEFLMFYHSHPDHDAYFSAMDRERAVWPTGDPFYPNANHLVVSVRSGRARDACYFAWDDARKEFVEVPATLPKT